MIGETNLTQLLKSMKPQLSDELFVFITLSDARYGDYTSFNPIASYQESEGLTLVVLKDVADQENLDYQSVFQVITLNVHSSLNAVGLTAAVASQLAEHNISANVIAAFYHDHIFVPVENAQQALQLLQKLSEEN